MEQCDGCGAYFGEQDLNIFNGERICHDCLVLAEDAASEEEDQIAMSRWGGL